MKIKSPAGEFHVTFHTMEVKDKKVMLKWRMGVWDAQGTVERRDIIWIFKTIFSHPSLIWVLLKTLLKEETIEQAGDEK